MCSFLAKKGPRASTAATVAIALLVAANGVVAPDAAAADVRRACRATGYFVFTYRESAGGVATTRTKRIDILQSDMEVVANSAGQMWSTATDAKRWACTHAAMCYVNQAAGAEQCGNTPLNAVYETIRKPEPIDRWRRDVDCGHARAGSVPGLKRTGANTVTLLQTKIVATASRDGITRNADKTVSESGHVCWSPSPAKPDAKDPKPPRRNDGDGPASRTDARHQPSRTDADHQPTRTDADHQPSRTDASKQPSRTDSNKQPTRTDATKQPSRTDAGHQPTRTDSDHQPSRTDPKR
jgi:hypothetical protein